MKFISDLTSDYLILWFCPASSGFSHQHPWFQSPPTLRGLPSQLRCVLLRTPMALCTQHEVNHSFPPLLPTPPSHSVTAPPYTHSDKNMALILYLLSTLSASSEMHFTDPCSLTSYICLSNAPSLLSPVSRPDSSYHLFPDSDSICLGSTLWGLCL